MRNSSIAALAKEWRDAGEEARKFFRQEFPELSAAVEEVLLHVA